MITKDFYKEFLEMEENKKKRLEIKTFRIYLNDKFYRIFNIKNIELKKVFWTGLEYEEFKRINKNNINYINEDGIYYFIDDLNISKSEYYKVSRFYNEYKKTIKKIEDLKNKINIFDYNNLLNKININTEEKNNVKKVNKI